MLVFIVLCLFYLKMFFLKKLKCLQLGEKEFNIKAHVLKLKSDEGHFFSEVLKPIHKKADDRYFCTVNQELIQRSQLKSTIQPQPHVFCTLTLMIPLLISALSLCSITCLNTTRGNAVCCSTLHSTMLLQHEIWLKILQLGVKHNITQALLF